MSLAPALSSKRTRCPDHSLTHYLNLPAWHKKQLRFMAANITLPSFHLGRNPVQGKKQMPSVMQIWKLPSSIRKVSISVPSLQLNRKKNSSLCFAVEESESSATAEIKESAEEIEKHIISSFTSFGSRHAEERMARKKAERFTYLIAAVMSTFGITSMAGCAVYSRFAWQMEV